MDVLEHEAYVDKVREGETDGFFFDETMAPGESDCDADPFGNGYLTEDEIHFGDDYKVQDYVPGELKQRIYFLYSQKGWDVKRLSQKFGLRTDRVSIIINMKDTEPEMVATGRYRDEADSLMTQMYAGRHEFNDPEPSTDQGIHVALLKDNQLPDDVHPVNPATMRGRVVRLPVATPPLEQPAKADRKFNSKFAVLSIGAGGNRRDKCIVVDYDGSVRQCSEQEHLYRSWTPKYTMPARAAANK